MRFKAVHVPGYVWCDVHGSIHDDTTDPFDTPDDRCTKADQRPVWIKIDPAIEEAPE